MVLVLLLPLLLRMMLRRPAGLPVPVIGVAPVVAPVVAQVVAPGVARVASEVVSGVVSGVAPGVAPWVVPGVALGVAPVWTAVGVECSELKFKWRGTRGRIQVAEGSAHRTRCRQSCPMTADTVHPLSMGPSYWLVQQFISCCLERLTER